MTDEQRAREVLAREAALACANEACRNMDGELDLDAMTRHFIAFAQPAAPAEGEDCGHCGGVGGIDDGDHFCMACGGSGKHEKLSPEVEAIVERATTGFRDDLKKIMDRYPRHQTFREWLKSYVGEQDANTMRFSVAELEIAFDNGALALPAPVASQGVGELCRFGHHPDPMIDYECEIDALIGMAYERLTMGGCPDLEDRISKAMTFRTLQTPGELRWLNQTFNGTREIYARKPGWVRWPEDKLAALSPPSSPVDADPPCTDCGDTGITYQTERRCACQGPSPVESPDLATRAATLESELERVREEILTQAEAEARGLV